MKLSDYQGKRVLVTGHTGFKGSWLSLWLLELGAIVTGLALAPEGEAPLFERLSLEKRMHHHLGDIRDSVIVNQVVAEADPDIVFHLAAQPLVRRSYREPALTWETNVTGTIHVMEAVRRLQKPCVLIAVTTDKVYENTECGRAFVETDPLGGHDPYSSSKAGAEIAIQSWRKSLFGTATQTSLASVRAGNVIGGGDMAEDRILPDTVRSLRLSQAVPVRNPGSTRPWQHVLDPLHGYLKLGAAMHEALLNQNVERRQILESAWNFGPKSDNVRTVADLMDAAVENWPAAKWTHLHEKNPPHEAALLSLDVSKARQHLPWVPVWDFRRTVAETIAWYRAAERLSAEDLLAFSLQQIHAFSQDAAAS